MICRQGLVKQVVQSVVGLMVSVRTCVYVFDGVAVIDLSAG